MFSGGDESDSEKHPFRPGSLCSICTICEVKSGQKTLVACSSTYRISWKPGPFLPLFQHCSSTCAQCPCEEGDQSDHCERCDVSMADALHTRCKFSVKTQPPDSWPSLCPFRNVHHATFAPSCVTPFARRVNAHAAQISRLQCVFPQLLCTFLLRWCCRWAKRVTVPVSIPSFYLTDICMSFLNFELMLAPFCVVPGPSLLCSEQQFVLTGVPVLRSQAERLSIFQTTQATVALYVNKFRSI